MGKPIFIMSLITGTLDGLAAVIMYYSKTGKDPMNIFRFIASGVFGTEAFASGLPIGMIGILLHYLIAFVWTSLFYFSAAKINWITRNWIITGVLFGILIWVVMNLMVLPLSLVPMKAEREWADIIIGALILVVLIGLPLAFSASRYFRRKY